ncbi:MAG: hypothetical protein DME61_07250 [Verrucomicrobia bacterium]|nr:MAG: hypothetical protein DME61_07250 [Verrucomicrobiota bacterium]
MFVGSHDVEPKFLSLMKTSLILTAMIAFWGLAVASTFAQTQTTTSSSTTYVQASKIVGTKVKSSQGEEIGVVKDVVLDRNTGCMAYTVLSTGGTGARVSAGGKMVAVPWAVYSPTSNVSELIVTVDRERIYNAPVFDYARIEEYSRPDYITNVYSYYGVSPGAAVGVGVSGSTTTTGTTTTGAATGAAATGGTTASPAGTSSPAATAPPARTPPKATRHIRDARRQSIAESARHGSNESTPDSRREATRNSFSNHSRRSNRHFTNRREARYGGDARRDNSANWPQRDRNAIRNSTSDL